MTGRRQNNGWVLDWTSLYFLFLISMTLALDYFLEVQYLHYNQCE